MASVARSIASRTRESRTCQGSLWRGSERWVTCLKIVRFLTCPRAATFGRVHAPRGVVVSANAIDHDCDDNARSIFQRAGVSKDARRKGETDCQDHAPRVASSKTDSAVEGRMRDGQPRPFSHEPVFSGNSRARETTSSRRKAVMFRDAKWNDVVARSSDRAGRSARRSTTQIRHGVARSQVQSIGHPIWADATHRRRIANFCLVDVRLGGKANPEVVTPNRHH